MSDRIHEITRTVDELLRRAQNWAQDDVAPPPIPDDIALSIQEADLICHSGDIPQSCQSLVIAVGRLGEEQRKYDNYEHGSRQQNQAPASSWWGAVKAVAIARQGAEKPMTIRRESVKELLRQGVSRNQIAGAIYGRRGEGPLMQANGTPDDFLIDKEAETAGSVLTGWPDWVAPWEVQNTKAQDRLAAQLAVIEKREEGRKYRDPASIEQMLKDGCYIQQIMRGKDCTRSEVMAVAEELGISPQEQPGSISEAVDLLLTDEDESTDKPHSLEALADRAERSDKVIEIWEGSNRQFGSPEIREALAKQGVEMSTKQIAAAIGHYKRKQNTQAEVTA